MKNEVPFKKQNAMRRNIIIYLMIFAGGSLIYKALNHIPINLYTGTMEAYILFLSLIVLTVQICRTIDIPVKDEKNAKERYLINRIGFHAILWGGILMHFVSNLIYNIWMEMSSNTFISVVILVGFIVAFLSSRKQGIYINQNLIGLDLKNYFFRIAKNIGKLWLVAIGYATVIYSLSLTLQIEFAIVTVVWSYILLSIILFSILYLTFSIYEKIDFDEKMLLATKKQRPFLSKKVVLLGLPIIGYAIITSGINFLYWQARLSGNVLTEQVLSSVNELLMIWLVDFAIVGLLLSYVVYHSIKSLPNEKPKLFKYFPVLIWINFVYVLTHAVLMISMSMYPGAFSIIFIQTFGTVTTYISFGLAFITLFIHIYIYPYLKNNHFPATKLFLIVPIVPILMHTSRQLIENFSSQANSVMVQIYLIAFILTFVSSLLYYFIYCSMSNDLFELKEIVIRQEESKVLLSKKLIH